MSKEKLLTIATLAALCVLAAFTLHAKAAGQQGMVVVRDPLTGKMRAPTPDELKELRAKAPPSTSLAPRGPTPVGPRDGARGVRLGDQNMVYDVVTRGPDGKLTRECVHGEAGVGRVLGHNEGERTDETR
ncbi:post-PEP-CTERM-1 domain-containing protein [Massilia rhizosphaerae]|uniref:post-PEP-CTERM-1 domain-containing protein n=1 Tax=Massilia rhizosphaerae TaxID=2784389 RepID=UPI0018DD5042|nr:hypothetical protein [Massilia rhizosphaerae]